MSVAQSWMDTIWRRTSLCSQTHTNQAQHVCHLLRKMVWVVRPLIVYVIKWHPWIIRVCRDTLDVSELAHNPLRPASNSNEPLAKLSWKTWNQMKVLDQSVLPIWHPTDIWNPETIQVQPVRRFRYLLDSLLRGNPLTRTWWHLVVVWISVALSNRGKMLIYPTLPRLHENHTNFKWTSKIKYRHQNIFVIKLWKTC